MLYVFSIGRIYLYVSPFDPFETKTRISRCASLDYSTQVCLIFLPEEEMLNVHFKAKVSVLTQHTVSWETIQLLWTYPHLVLSL
jgi:hypothetical protein